jgi:class 3 adenylate cyclase
MVHALRRIVASDIGLVVRAGVNSGLAFAGDVGAANRRTYAVTGDTVNLAARLTARAEGGEVLATAAVLDASTTRYDALEASSRQGKSGRSRPTASAKRSAARPNARTSCRSSGATPSSRCSRCARLRSPRTSRLVELVGEPGIGKSRCSKS